jgi:hypothetical protein
MYTREEQLGEFRAKVREESGVSESEQRIEALARERLAEFLASEPTSKMPFHIRELAGIPIIAGDDVAAYFGSLPPGNQISDLVASMAPPFERFFVEFQNVPYRWFPDSLHAWGALVVALDDPSKMPQFQGDDGKPRWMLNLYTFLEREKGEPFGPVAEHLAGLAEDGTWFQHSDGALFWAGTPWVDGEQPSGWRKSHADLVAELLFPVLLTISFMHCKNVTLRSVSPPLKLSRKHRKNHGQDLVRYHVLEVGAIRRILDIHTKGAPGGLRHALHICRGHFKTFTPDAPLLGRHVGTYWWDPQVRGAQEHGTVLKDYRVRAPRELGRAYREANENPPESHTEAPADRNPDSGGRGLAAHSRTQNLIAGVLRRLGLDPVSPREDEPEFDLAWKSGETFYVCEVKSTTAANEERQLRMAIGQVIRYRQKLVARGYEPTYGVIATERGPSDSSWHDLCESEGILLLWPDVAEGRLRQLSG